MKSPEQRAAIRQASIDRERADIEREHRGLPPVVLIDGDPVSRARFEEVHPRVREGERVVFRYVGCQTEHDPRPECSRPGPHPIAECPLWG